jgi:hypothetical protein
MITPHNHLQKELFGKIVKFEFEPKSKVRIPTFEMQENIVKKVMK